ncbi:MAG: inositol monophosphatase [Opitutaceae bacterium]|jgi:fructose-1,6-bisphosphatase/inositol monophosphatase family enzyme
MTILSLEKARRLLCRMQDCIRDAVLAARRRDRRILSGIAAVTAADTIYQVDRVAEKAIMDWFATEWPRRWPVELVMEGLEDQPFPTTFPLGAPVKNTLFKCIIDPIDGTRLFMEDKRSAWILTGLAPQRGTRNSLGDIVLAVMTELPASKQWRSDQLSAVRGGSLCASGQDLRTGRRERLSLRPSQARDFKHGFSTVIRFFPDGLTLLAEFEEALWAEMHKGVKGDSPVVFNDQYISTGGQVYELIAGHDRMIADLRPLAFQRLGIPEKLVCHPYDICTALLLEAAGGVVETPDGKPLREPLDTISPVSWVGYANSHLARKIRPILRRLCRERLGNKNRESRS